MATIASPFATFAASTAPSATSSSSTSTGLGGSAPTEQMFLQLLVAQMKYQDPMNPTDSTQFVSQLAQFSDLEQTIAIRKDTDTLAGTSSTTTSSSSGADTSGSSGSSSSSGTSGSSGSSGSGTGSN